PTRPQDPHQDAHTEDSRADRIDASPAKSGGADTAVLEPPSTLAPSPMPSRLPPVRTETFAPRKKPLRPGGSRWRNAVPAVLVVAAVLAAVGTSPYWAMSLASHLPWVAPGDSGIVLARVNEITDRLDALDQRLDKRLTELAARTTGSEEATHRLDTALADGGKHLDSLEKGLTQLSAGGESADTPAGSRNTSIEEQARKLEAELGAQSQRIETLDKGLGALTASGGSTDQATQKLTATLTEQRGRLDQLDQRFQALVTSTDTANA